MSVWLSDIRAKGYQGSSYRHLGLPPAGAHLLDPRLTLIESLIPGVFRDRCVLDIGCNNGTVTVQLGLSAFPHDHRSLIISWSGHGRSGKAQKLRCSQQHHPLAQHR